MSFVYRYLNDPSFVVRSVERRHDLEEWAYWERVDGVEAVAASARVDSVEAETVGQEPETEIAPEPYPVEKPKRTRAPRKPSPAEGEA